MKKRYVNTPQIDDHDHEDGSDEAAGLKSHWDLILALLILLVMLVRNLKL